jgi:hypothetical protein
MMVKIAARYSHDRSYVGERCGLETAFVEQRVRFLNYQFTGR